MQRITYDTLEKFTENDRPNTVSASFRRLPIQMFETLNAWRNRTSQRRHLRQLDDRLLKDMGLTHAEVDREIRKPFWTR